MHLAPRAVTWDGSYGVKGLSPAFIQDILHGPNNINIESH